jgi:hypothetical protein
MLQADPTAPPQPCLALPVTEDAIELNKVGVGRSNSIKGCDIIEDGGVFKARLSSGKLEAVKGSLSWERDSDGVQRKGQDRDVPDRRAKLSSTAGIATHEADESLEAGEVDAGEQSVQKRARTLELLPPLPLAGVIPAAADPAIQTESASAVGATGQQPDPSPQSPAHGPPGTMEVESFSSTDTTHGDPPRPAKNKVGAANTGSAVDLAAKEVDAMLVEGGDDDDQMGLTSTLEPGPKPTRPSRAGVLNHLQFTWVPTVQMIKDSSWFLVELRFKVGPEAIHSARIVKAPTVSFEQLQPRVKYYARVAVVPKDTILSKDNKLISPGGQASQRGPWSPKSYPYETKDIRPSISDDVRRYVWASFYVAKVPGGSDEHNNPKYSHAGMMADSPCLACQARGADPVMLRPLLDNVDAAHIIADAKGGPHGEKKEEVWNFFPCCATCNRGLIQTKNAIEWFYEECKKRNESYGPLFELLFRLWRAREINLEDAPTLQEFAMLQSTGAKTLGSVVGFAFQFYHDGHPAFLGGRIQVEGVAKTIKHSANGGGFITLKRKALDSAWHAYQGSNRSMRTRIDEMDDASTQMLALATMLTQKIRITPIDPASQIVDVLKGAKKIIKDAEEAIKGL